MYNSENIRPAQSCEIFFQTKLLLNEKTASLKKLNDEKIEIIITNDNDVATSKYFEGIKLSYKQDYPIEFLVPPKTKSIRVKFTAKIFLQKGGFQDISWEKHLQIDRFDTAAKTFLAHRGGNGNNKQSKFWSVYLRNVNSASAKGYVLNFLGKNGEGVQDIHAEVFLSRNFLQQALTSSDLHKRLISDANGQIFLGELKEIGEIRVTVQRQVEAKGGSGMSDERFSWTIDTNNYNTHIPHEYTICEGDRVI